MDNYDKMNKSRSVNLNSMNQPRIGPAIVANSTSLSSPIYHDASRQSKGPSIAPQFFDPATRPQSTEHYTTNSSLTNKSTAPHTQSRLYQAAFQPSSRYQAPHITSNMPPHSHSQPPPTFPAPASHLNVTSFNPATNSRPSTTQQLVGQYGSSQTTSTSDVRSFSSQTYGSVPGNQHRPPQRAQMQHGEPTIPPEGTFRPHGVPSHLLSAQRFENIPPHSAMPSQHQSHASSCERSIPDHRIPEHMQNSNHVYRHQYLSQQGAQGIYVVLRHKHEKLTYG